MSILANFNVQKQNSKSYMTSWSKCGANAFFLFLALIMVAQAFWFRSPTYAQQTVQPEKTTKARYQDFYRHQEWVKSQNAEREKGRSAQKAKRIKAEEQHEQSRINYVQKRKSNQAEERAAKAEAWILEQRIKDDAQREKAKKDYLARKNSNQNYVIPEDVEYGIDPPPLDFNGSKPAQAPQGSGRLRF